MEKTMSMHFTIDGAWFTWFLRHLWIEGNQTKALKTWGASFPHLMERKHVVGVFLDVVSGRMKFSGDSDGPNGFKLEVDGAKWWNPSQGGKPDKAWPLLATWEDVILVKQCQLFLKELDLREFRLARAYPDTRAGNNYHSRRWIGAAEENRLENGKRKVVGELLADIMNIEAATGMAASAFPLPGRCALLEDKSIAHVKPPSRRVKENPSLDSNKKFYSEVIETLVPARVKLKKRYGTDFLYVGDTEIMALCGLDVGNLQREMSDDRSTRYEPRGYFKSDGDDAISKETRRRAASLSMLSMAGTVIPGLDLESYIDNMMKDQGRGAIQSEDPLKTEWKSGYIDPDGRFYGCADIAHRDFSIRLCEELGIINKPEIKKWNLVKRGDPTPEPPDCELLLDKRGWMRVSVMRFFWDNDFTPTLAQRGAIRLFMAGKNMTEAVFNNPLKTIGIDVWLKSLESEK